MFLVQFQALSPINVYGNVFSVHNSHRSGRGTYAKHLRGRGLAFRKHLRGRGLAQAGVLRHASADAQVHLYPYRARVRFLRRHTYLQVPPVLRLKLALCFVPLALVS